MHSFDLDLVSVYPQDVTSDEIVATVSESVLRSRVFQQGHASGFKVICDMLISCSSQQRLASDLLQNHAFTVLVGISKNSLKWTFCVEFDIC